ncbi:S8 family serine peptidase [Cellulomonas sp. NS3]|uniref:S8 family serine peptidase n=1 Tax=Cellulomonas sp. NS3 TaxID=2973977 RepID=UPI0021619D9C|nr:S8 family serine peptidase [Cellulomonas sp. NS3]
MRRRVAGITALCVGFGLAAGVLPAAGAPAGASPAAVADPTGGERPTDRGDVPSFAPAPEAEPAPEADHVLVRFVDDATPTQERAVLGAVGARGADEVDGTGFVEVPVGDEAPEDVLARLEADPLVAEVQLDHVRSAAAWTDDPLLEHTWPYLDLTRLPRAWDLSTGAGTVIAVLDTGVDARHPDLAGSVEPGIDLVSGDSNPADDHGHGTIVAGAAMAHGDNGVGAVGAAYGARLLPVKVLDARGNGADSVVAQGIAWAVDHGADVLNLSLGGSDPSPVLLAAMQAAVARGVVVVVAAGNDGSDVAQYPAAYAPQVAGVLAVGATDDDGALTDFSSWGDWVSIAAPGSRIVGPAAGGGYAQADGTSLAAPFVSGTAALVLARTPGATPALVEDRLVSTARDAGPRGVDPFYGRGVLDAAAAVDSPTARTVAPAVPLDRAPRDADDAGDTSTNSQVLEVETWSHASAQGTLAPEGDVDWYRYDATSAGYYAVEVQNYAGADRSPALDLVLEVQAPGGRVLLDVDESETSERGIVSVPDAWSLSIAVRNANGSSPEGTYRLTVSATPRPVFLPSAQPGPDGGAVGAAELTGDGLVDSVLAVPGETSVLLHPGRGDATLAPAVRVAAGGTLSGTQVAVLDVEGDGRTDVAVTTTSGIQVLRQDAGTLVAAGLTPVAGGAREIEAADLDVDGDVDLVVNAGADAGGATQAFINDGAGGFTAGASLGTLCAPVAVGDLTQDGRPDVVCGTEVHPQLADGSFGPGVALDGPAGGNVVIGDLTADGLPDVVRAAGGLSINPALPGGGFGERLLYDNVATPRALALGDVDGNGLLDVVGAARRAGSVSVMFQSASGTLSTPTSSAVPWQETVSAHGLALAHLDGDGLLDGVLAGDSVLALRQTRLDWTTGRVDWVHDVFPEPHAAGVAVRPTVTVHTFPDVAPSSVTEQTVRLVDGTTGTAVSATRSYEARTHRVSITPTADLVRGRHYELLVSGLTSPAGAVQPGTFRSWFTVAAGGDRFTPVDPLRVLDTRDGTGVGGGALQSGRPVSLPLGDLLPPGATAVVLNVTSTQATGTGNVRVYPTPAGAGGPPEVSNLNIVQGVDQPNLVTVALGAGGSVDLMADGPSTHAVADLAGYYAPGAATAFVPMSPVRALDTRDGTGGVPSAPVRGGRWVDLVVTGRNGVPVDATAVVLNVTATHVAEMTHVRVYPAPAASESAEPPVISNLNLRPGRDQANLVTVRVGDGGRVRFFTYAADLHLVADLAGYYAPTGDNGYVALAPQRLADTRTGLGISGGPLQPGVPATLTVTGWRGVPEDASSVVLNVTGVAPQAVTHVRVFPTTTPATLPLVSNLNLVAGRDEPNLVIVRPGTGGRVSFYAPSSTLHLVADVSGYFRR